MTRDDANKLAAYFRGLMPVTTDEQVIVLRDRLLGVEDVAAAKARLTKYASTRSNFDLPSALAAASGPRRGVQPGSESNVYGQTAEERQAERERDDDTLRERAADRELVESMPTAEVDSLCAEVLSLMPEGLRDFFAKRPTLESPVLFQNIAKMARSKRWRHAGKSAAEPAAGGVEISTEVKSDGVR